MCMHPEESYVLIGNTLSCQRCEEDAAVPAPAPVEQAADFQLLPHPTALTPEVEAEVTAAVELLAARTAAADCEGRREDALALRLALQVIRNITGRVARPPVTPSGRPRLTLVA